MVKIAKASKSPYVYISGGRAVAFSSTWSTVNGDFQVESIMIWIAMLIKIQR